MAGLNLVVTTATLFLALKH
jgi:hypothetical protein